MRKLNKKQMEETRALLKGALQIQTQEVIDAIKQQPDGDLAVHFVVDMVSQDSIYQVLLPQLPDTATDEEKQCYANKEKSIQALMPQLQNIFITGYIGGMSHKDIMASLLPIIEEIEKEPK